MWFTGTEKVYSNKYTVTGLLPGRKYFLWVIVCTDSGDTDPLDSQEQRDISRHGGKRKTQGWAQAPCVALGMSLICFAPQVPTWGLDTRMPPVLSCPFVGNLFRTRLPFTTCVCIPLYSSLCRCCINFKLKFRTSMCTKLVLSCLHITEDWCYKSFVL